ncbi:uncharacterized protein LOC108600952 [Drosophila busckii]|uniref:uncharacterized protein LOC108600952 n=1 Tax=Drosophila busckii TaxID=30019 RepID=UPI0014329A31|nr:uncharacterized protein LOC108600952 [Drosophila busckii]
MKSFVGTSLVLLLLATASISAMPQRRQLKSQRQVELASTPYPAAGFRPRIAFELPNERQPKLEEPLTTTTPATAPENFDAPATEPQQQQEARTPANTYGAPETAEDTVEVVAQVPAKDFQPPVREAVENFGAVDSVADEQQPVFDLPALDQEQSATPLGSEDEITSTEVALKVAATPANTYGAPNTRYGAPDIREPTNELETEESQVEVFADKEEELNDAALGLANGRLILLPISGNGAQFGRLVLAVEQPQRQQEQARQRIRSERLRRN